jgi:type IV pilus assembly protein PilB
MIRISDVKQVGGVKQAAKAIPAKALAVPKRPKRSGTSLKPADFADGSEAARTLDTLVEDAASARASAVHIEPRGTDIFVRYRIDGLLRPGKTILPPATRALIARVKLLANLDVEESRVPQDGRFQADTTKEHHLIRAAVVPVADGEKLVLHIVDESATTYDLSQLGFWGHSLHALQDGITQNHGLIIVSGPAGSGKTSTLYGLLQVVADPSLNIVTVEDSIEHRLASINQTPVNLKAGMTYAGALRAVLRQDPNVLMVSELREPETAGMALQAALSGRLVLAGMHTHDVASTLAHLVAMSMEPYLLASVVRTVVNQRLVRRLCTKCREPYKPVAGEFESACAACGLQPSEAISHLALLQKAAAAENAIEVGAKVISAGKVVRLWRANPGGCEACGGTGYKGRVAIAEVLTVSPHVQKLIFSTTSPAAIYGQAIAEGMVPLPMDGFVKALLGQTSVEEVLRVVTQ